MNPSSLSIAPQGQFHRPFLGLPASPVMIVCDPQTPDASSRRQVMDRRQFGYLTQLLEEAGIPPGMVQFVGLCPPIPEAATTDKRIWEFAQAHCEQIPEIIAHRQPRIVIPIGKLALRAVTGKSQKIMDRRGVVQKHNDRLIFPIISPGMVMRVPEHKPLLRADLATLKRIIDADFDETILQTSEVRYEWRDDISDLLGKNKPKMIAVDTETTGLTWYKGVRVLTVQITPKEGVSYLCAINPDYRAKWFNDHSGRRGTQKLRAQIKELLEDPEVYKIFHNGKYDVHVLRNEGIHVEGFAHDTQLLAFAVDENMQNKSLTDCIKRWVPAMAGYSDRFDQLVNKGRMMDVPPEDVFDEHGTLVMPGMRNYAGGDTDAAFRLAKVLVPELKRDWTQYTCYRRIIMPGMLTFANTVEVHGQVIDREYLARLETEIRQWVATEYTRLIKLVPPAVRLKHLQEKGEEGMKFSRDAFMRDILFTKEGFNLKPRVYTGTTKHYEELARQATTPQERDHFLSLLIPSVSAKDHLPYFEDARGKAGEFVRGFKQYQKATKLLSTYIGEQAKGTGFWKYISEDGRIHPSYRLDRTNTGRTSSQEPNGQNVPKRGELAKTYAKCFTASIGYRRVNVDLSQIELRLVAWMAGEATMLEIYRTGGDIHTATAMAVNRLTQEQWDALPEESIADEDSKDLLRFKAKAVNFGFVYGMGWRGFKVYAKTQYGVDYTDREAEETRRLYFAQYPGLLAWHDRMKAWARKHGYVRSLHGAIRRLPSIASDDDGIQALAERQAVNAPIQRFGSDLGVMAMAMLARHADPEILRPVGFIHDCLCFEAKIGYEEQAAAAIKWVMENIPLQRWFGITCPIPIVADAEVENEAGKMEKRKQMVAEFPWFWQQEKEDAFEQFMRDSGVYEFDCNGLQNWSRLKRSLFDGPQA